MWASVNGHVAVVEWLLKHGANIDYQAIDVSINRVIFIIHISLMACRRLMIL
jgi:ankyrin repeat protein